MKNEERQFEPLAGKLLSAWPIDVPTGLADRTWNRIARLKQDDSAIIRAVHRFRWQELVGLAAGIVLLATMFIPGIRQARRLADRAACASNLRFIGTGLGAYAQTHQGQLPYIPNRPSADWFRIGHAGKQNQSNTRNLFLLVRSGHVKVNIFICPRASDAQPARPPRSEQHDFPSPKHISYSFQNLFGPHRPGLTAHGKMPVLADRNPLTSKELPNYNLAETLNSLNHPDGQNVLRFNGEVFWAETPLVGLDGDNIYRHAAKARTIHGHETPTHPRDTFLVP